MTPTTITSIDAKLEYIVEIMVRMAEYEEKSIKEFRSDLVELKESSKNFDQKLDRLAQETAESSKRLDQKMDRLAQETAESSKRLDQKMDRLAQETAESSRRLDQKMDRLAEETAESSRRLDQKMDRVSEQILIVNETSKRQEHNIDRLVGIVEALVKNVG